MMTDLMKTPLHDFHHCAGAKMVEFAGWDMPVQYQPGIMAEHKHTREQASLFDVSHMGQVLVRGKSLESAGLSLETVTPANVIGLKQWRQRYGLFTTVDGGILDDFMFANHEDHWFLVVNAARIDHDTALLRCLDGLEVEHLTNRALIAVQGPKAEQEIAKLIPAVPEMVFMDSKKYDYDGYEVWVSRSGYTGEDGFEVSLPDVIAQSFAERLIAGSVVKPAGLGARDSLRLEAGMPLYGHDLTTDITPVQAALSWSIPKVRRPGGSREGGYAGADVIGQELIEGAVRLRVGIQPEGRAPLRDGVKLFANESSTEVLGVVTSGGFGPTVGGPIAMAMLPSSAAPGQNIYAELRGKRVLAKVTELPFVPPNYKR